MSHIRHPLAHLTRLANLLRNIEPKLAVDNDPTPFLQKGSVMAEGNAEQRNEEPRAVNENIANQAQQQTEIMREAAQRGKETIETTINASQQALERGASELNAQSEQAVVLAKEFIEAQTSVVEVAMRTVENAADVSSNSTRLWANASSAWIEMMQKLMQLNIDSVRRLREAQDFSRPLEAQAGLMRETIAQMGRSQSRIMESARESAAAASRQIEKVR